MKDLDREYTTKNLRAIAIHLPQFHPIPENDKAWGKGFTEWTNVTKARPLFEGHYQPHLPADLGFYDLRLQETRHAQSELAKEYGIHGFCYYHYWFTGRKVLERPVEDILLSGKPDFPFMLCWANENWTRKWDGGSNEIIMKQEYSLEDDINHIRYLIPFFKDPRYIRINNKPVFAIYRDSLIPEVDKTIDLWRGECRKEGIDLYLCRFETFGFFGRKHLGNFDAGIEFQPNSEMLKSYLDVKYKTEARKLNYRLKYQLYKLLNREQDLKIKMKKRFMYKVNYDEYIQFILDNYNYKADYSFFPGVTPSWDNSARNSINPFIFLNANPESYKKWLLFHVKNFRPRSTEENVIFINAWNEWAEGNHLEPCQKWGRRYLEATREALEK